MAAEGLTVLPANVPGLQKVLHADEHCCPRMLEAAPPTILSQLSSAIPSLAGWRLPPPPDTPQKSYSFPWLLWQPPHQLRSSYRHSCFPLQSTAVSELLPPLRPGELGQEFSSDSTCPAL